MTRLQTGRTLWLLRGLICFFVLSLAWLQVGPAYAGAASALRHKRELRQWQLAHPIKPFLPDGLTDTPGPELLPTIRANEDKERKARKAKEDGGYSAALPAAALRGGRVTRLASAAPVRAADVSADMRRLTPAEMRAALGRGQFRNPYFSGTLPWQRSFRDVNLCNGNLFKSFTDVQVAAARGAGLVLQRTYNANDARVGPFGVGWTHAYDIRNQEAGDVHDQSNNASVDDNADDVPRTDFFGAKHTYHRDADGLYSPPGYMFDEMGSDYDSALVNGPTKVMADTEKGEDGTVKHYINILTLNAGTPSATEGNERACDYIEDRHGNRTTLTYGLTVSLPSDPSGSTRKLLTQVTDPSGRSLTFTWTNLSTGSQPVWRITQVQGPLSSGSSVPGVTYRVVYGYYTDPNDPNAANELYNLQSVTLDPDGVNRTTTYAYTGATGTYTDANNQTQTATENGLLASVTDPLGHTVSYGYSAPSSSFASFTGTVWVTGITEPSGVTSGGAQRTLTWSILLGQGHGSSDYSGENLVASVSVSTTDPDVGSGAGSYFQMDVDNLLRAVLFYGNVGGSGGHMFLIYDGANNVTNVQQVYMHGRAQVSTYGAHGNVLTTTTAQTPSGQTGSTRFPYADSTTSYYDADRYFAKKTVADGNGHATFMDYYTSTDASIGNRGEVKLVQDAGYGDPSSPSYQKQFTYTYNQYGQKASETNLNGVVTTYSYGDQWGNLTQVVQDPGGAGHLNRTTTMVYDAAGRVLQSTDPAGQTSTFTYNALGQPLTVATPAKGSAPAETITYNYGDVSGQPGGNGRTVSVTDGRGTTTMAYEAGCDRVHSVTDPVTGTTSYTYRAGGERASVSLPGGGTWTYEYYLHYLLPAPDPAKMTLPLTAIVDDQGRRVTVAMSENGLAYVQTNQVYDQSGNRVSWLETDYTYDMLTESVTHDWVTRQKTTWTGPMGPVNPYLGHPSTYTRVVNENDYTYDQAGNRLVNAVSTQAMNADGTPQFDSNYNPILNTRTEKYEKADGSSGYDAVNRLTNVDYGDGQTQSYTFDAMGNRLSRQDSASGTTNSAYNAANMLLSTTGAGASAYSNDLDGNTLTGGGRTNTWDSQNRLVSCITSGNSSTFKYGADGLRRQKTTNGTTMDYAYDGTMMVREGHAAGGSLSQVTATYLIGARGPEYRRDDTQTQTDGQGHTFGKTGWYVYDGLGSVVGEVDPLGNLTSSPKYDVYGAVRGNGGTASTKQGFVGGLGHLSEPETGLIYMRARYYDPSMGRFVGQDPGLHGSNWFVYASGNSTNRVDPSGKIDEDPEEGLAESGLAEIKQGVRLLAVAGRDFGAFLTANYKALAVSAENELLAEEYKANGASAGLMGVRELAQGIAMITDGTLKLFMAQADNDWPSDLGGGQV